MLKRGKKNRANEHIVSYKICTQKTCLIMHNSLSKSANSAGRGNELLRKLHTRSVTYAQGSQDQEMGWAAWVVTPWLSRSVKIQVSIYLRERAKQSRWDIATWKRCSLKRNLLSKSANAGWKLEEERAKRLLQITYWLWVFQNMWKSQLCQKDQGLPYLNAVSGGLRGTKNEWIDVLGQDLSIKYINSLQEKWKRVLEG